MALIGAMKNFVIAPCDKSKDQMNPLAIPSTVLGVSVSIPWSLVRVDRDLLSIVSVNLPDFLACAVALAEFNVPPEKEPVKRV